MADLIAWLDDQEQKPFLRVAPMDETVEAFDPLHRRCGADDFAIPARIEEIYDCGQRGMQGRGAGIYRTRTWRFTHELKKPLVPQPPLMSNIDALIQSVKSIIRSVRSVKLKK